MDMLTAAEAAKKWNVTPRRVQDLCKRGEIQGVQRLGRAWMIPADAKYPGECSADVSELPEEAEVTCRWDVPFLHLTEFFHTPGTAEACAEELAENGEAAALFGAGISLCRGEIERACEYAEHLLSKPARFNFTLTAGFLLAMCAIWRGDAELWRQAKKHICDAPFTNEEEQELMTLTLANVDNEIYDTTSIPDWFERGSFESLPRHSLAIAKVFYAGFLYVRAHELAWGQVEVKGQKGLSLMQLLPNIYEPMIAQAQADGTLITEIYLRFYCAQAYYHTGDRPYAVHHIDRALALAIPDGLYGIIAEQRKNLDALLDERIMAIAPEILSQIKELHKVYSVGWAGINNVVRNRYVCVSLTAREREIARLAAFGLKNRQIAEQLCIAESTVKQAIRIAVYKSGVGDRDELYTIL